MFVVGWRHAFRSERLFVIIIIIIIIIITVGWRGSEGWGERGERRRVPDVLEAALALNTVGSPATGWSEQAAVGFE